MTSSKKVLSLLLIAGVGFVLLVFILSATYFVIHRTFSTDSDMSSLGVLPQPATTMELSPTPEEITQQQKDEILKDLVAGGLVCDSQTSGYSCSVDKVVGDFAKGTKPQSYWIAAKSGGSWKMVISGNGIPDCGKIDKYSVPRQIYGNCLESSGSLRF